jgi:replicative DNA helicase
MAEIADPIAERAVLGAVILRPDLFERAAEVVSADDFSDEKHRLVFRALETLVTERKPIDVVTIGAALASRVAEVGGPAGIAALTDYAMPSAIDAYAAIVREKSTLRRAMRTCAQLAAQAESATDVGEYLAVLEYEIAQVLERRSDTRPRERSKSDLLNAALWKLEHQISDAVRTGFPALDQAFGGFTAGDLSVLAARTSRGKTSFATCIALNAARENHGVLFVSLEQPTEEMIVRFLGSLAGVNVFRIKQRGYRDDEHQRIRDAATMLEALPVEIAYRPGLRPRDLRIECRRVQRRGGSKLKLVIIDYLALMRGDVRERERWREMQEVVLALKEIASELGVAALVLQQLNRETDDKHPPSLANLRDTGSLEEHASNVLFLWQPPAALEDVASIEQDTAINLVVGKQRNGPAGFKVPMMFDKRTGMFRA